MNVMFYDVSIVRNDTARSSGNDTDDVDAKTKRFADAEHYGDAKGGQSPSGRAGTGKNGRILRLTAGVYPAI